MSNQHELEVKEFRAALAEMREAELARLLDMVEALTQELHLMSLHNSESVAAAAAAHRLLKLWNNEVAHILKLKREHDAAKLE